MIMTYDPDVDVTLSRKIVKLSTGIPASDGGGVKLTRIIGAPGLEQVDPFLLFDVFPLRQSRGLHRRFSTSSASRL
jgi:hypothetical protein